MEVKTLNRFFFRRVLGEMWISTKCMKRFGGFLKWWYPQIIHFNRVFHYKPSILGYHHLRKHPFEWMDLSDRKMINRLTNRYDIFKFTYTSTNTNANKHLVLQIVFAHLLLRSFPWVRWWWLCFKKRDILITMQVVFFLGRGCPSITESGPPKASEMLIEWYNFKLKKGVLRKQLQGTFFIGASYKIWYSK